MCAYTCTAMVSPSYCSSWLQSRKMTYTCNPDHNYHVKTIEIAMINLTVAEKGHSILCNHSISSRDVSNLNNTHLSISNLDMICNVVATACYKRLKLVVHCNYHEVSLIRSNSWHSADKMPQKCCNPSQCSCILSLIPKTQIACITMRQWCLLASIHFKFVL